MKEVLCPFNLFDLKQPIYICDTDRQTLIYKVEFPDLVNMMLEAGINNRISVFHLMGNTLMCEKLAEEIKTQYNIRYGAMENNIEVKVN